MIHHAKDLYALIVLAAIALFVSGGALKLYGHSAAPSAFAYAGVLLLVAMLWRLWFHAEIKEAA